MHKRTFIRYIALLFLFPVLLLQGCWLDNMPVYVPPHVPAQPVIETPPVYVEDTPAPAAPVQSRFTLRYEPASTLNPIMAMNRDNIGIASLLYEPLFILDELLNPRSLLCESWETEDNITWNFTIYPDIMMHDGSTLTADDVTYTLRQARQRGRHREKLHNITSVTSDGELTVTVKLGTANARITRLLDIPIIKADTMDDPIPPGTGPYMFPNPDNLLLTRFSNHRNFSNMPLPTIYLRVVPQDSLLTELFDRGDISLLWDDPTGSFEVRINRDHEPWYYNTTALQYLGFNAQTGILRNGDVRRAIGCAVERNYIVDTIMNTRPGQTIVAPVPISSVFNMYDIEWEQQLMDPKVEMAALLERSGIMDYDEDGFLELTDGIGGPGIDFKLDFLVNIENSNKVAATEYIAECLRQVGFNIEVKPLPWSEFIRSLENGEFDIYYGEVQLGADFDLAPLLLPGERYLNYGRTASNSYDYYISNFLAAETYEEVSIAGKQLCDEIRINAPFVPVLYKRHAVYTPLGLVSLSTGSSPTQSGVFYNFTGWSIDLEMLT